MQRPITAASEGYKDATNMWHTYSEEFVPLHDLGKGSSCAEDSTGMVLTCTMTWFNQTTTTALTFTFNAQTLVGSGTLATPDGKAHAFPNCHYGGM